MSYPVITHHDLSLSSGASIHYMTTGPSVPTTPTILLLHGFPSSSHQFRTLVPLLAKASSSLRVIAPDLPGFGLTTVPEDVGYKYTFENMTKTMVEFLEEMGVGEMVVYGFDYGFPVAFRLALIQHQHRPRELNSTSQATSARWRIKALISQNGNGYVEGLLPSFWAPLQSYWSTSNIHDGPSRQTLQSFLSDPNNLKSQYFGTTIPSKAQSDVESDRRVDRIDPVSWKVDWMMNVRDRLDIQLDYFYDYQTNVELYPAFQTYLRESKVPLLAAWGRHDVAFDPIGAEMFRRDAHDSRIHFLDGTHFLLETHVEEVTAYIVNFLDDIGF
ncbi:hypothetical protein IAR55_000308 [Kwoniella newhampshirensis]|uniref:AB hydrolase-1 domain-containing protein n=1 Tax=Kwoniella newhampshirensis TaxID=1651941 RepID=A0AAW0Z6C9_9TREE